MGKASSVPEECRKSQIYQNEHLRSTLHIPCNHRILFKVGVYGMR